MPKVRRRIGIDFPVIWSPVDEHGAPLDFTGAENMHVFIVQRGGLGRVQEQVFSVVDNKILIDFIASEQKAVGVYDLFARWQRPDAAIEGGVKNFSVYEPRAIELLSYDRAFNEEDGLNEEIITVMASMMKGDPFTYDDFTPEQLEALKGDPLKFSDLTEEQKEELRGVEGKPGKTPVIGTINASPVASNVSPSFTLTDSGTTDANGNPIYNGSISIPKGGDGEPGDPGKNPVLSIGTVSTVAAGQPASASVVADGFTPDGNPKYKINLSLPQGAKGEPGDGAGNTIILNNSTGQATKQYVLKPSANGSLEYNIEEISLSEATTTASGLMPASDKGKLNGIEAGAQKNVQSDWNATEGDALIKNKPTALPPTSHDHDDRYYTEGEVDTKLSGKADKSTTYTKTETDAALNGKVDKIDGKGLSTNDYTTAEKNKLAGISAGAEVNVQSDWAQTDNTADDFIKNKPTIPEGATLYSTTGQNTDGAMTQKAVTDALGDKVDKEVGKGLFSGSYSDLTSKPDLTLKEDKSNKKTAWSATPSDTNYPSEKLVKESLDNKASKTDALTAVSGQMSAGGAGDAFTIKQTKNGVQTNVGAIPFAERIGGLWFAGIPNGYMLRRINVLEVTVATAAATVAKVGTTEAANYTPTVGDELLVTFTNGNSATNPTLAIDGSAAKNIRLGTAAISNIAMGVPAGAKVRMFYDGTQYQLYGSQKVNDNNTTYAEISTTEIDVGTASDLRSLSARRAKYIIDKAIAGLPTASASVKGGIKVGSNLSISDGVLSATDTTYSKATTSADGLMSKEDKGKLNGIETGAQKNVQADWDATSGDALIKNKPTSFTPSAHSHDAATTTAPGFMSKDDKIKLNGLSANSIKETRDNGTLQFWVGTKAQFDAITTKDNNTIYIYPKPTN